MVVVNFSITNPCSKETGRSTGGRCTKRGTGTTLSVAGKTCHRKSNNHRYGQ